MTPEEARPLLAAVLGASLAGSVHCAGMCGGIVAAAVGGDGRAAPHLAYHGARGAAYALLGAAAGALGAVLDLAGAATGIARAGAVVAGVALVAMGTAALLEARGVDVRGALGVRSPGAPGAGSRLLAIARPAAFQAALRRPPALRAALLGLSSALLPCGWLWAFIATAAGSGGALSGALVMAAFWAGTVPLLALGGAGLAALAGPLRRRVPTLTALLLVAIGLATVGGRALRPIPALAASTTESLPSAPRASCCDADSTPPPSPTQPTPAPALAPSTLPPTPEPRHP